VPTQSGKDLLLKGTGAPLLAVPTPAMLGEEEAAAAAAEAAAQRHREQSACETEETRLFQALHTLRQSLAAAADIAPTMVLSDTALWEMVRQRPDEPRHLSRCEGCSVAFIERYGQAFVDEIVQFCGREGAILTAGTAWRSARSANTASLRDAPHLAPLLTQPKASL